MRGGWVIGALVNGVIQSAVSRITNETFFNVENIKSIKGIVNDGYKWNMHFYYNDIDSAYNGETGWKENGTIIDVSNVKYIRLTLMRTDGAEMNADEGTNVILGMTKAKDEVEFWEKTTIVSCYPNSNSSLRVSGAATVDCTIVQSGKNMLVRNFYEEQDTKTINGITFTVNPINGEITANGTATANADFYFRNTSAPVIQYRGTPLFLSACTEGEQTEKKYFVYSSISGDEDNGKGCMIKGNIGALYIRIMNGKTVENVVFRPQLEIGYCKTDYVPSAGTVKTNLKGTITLFQALNGVNIFHSELSELSVKYMCSASGVNQELSANISKTENKFILNTTGGTLNASVKASGHRGMQALAPENTIHAFRKAVEMDMDILESDIWFTSDGYPVMFHDEKIDRVVADGYTGNVRDFTLAELQAMQFSCPSQFGDTYYGTSNIMTLEQFLRFARAVNKECDIEIKDTTATTEEVLSLIPLVEKYGMMDKIVWNGSESSYVNLYTLLAEYPKCNVAYIIGNGITRQKIYRALTLKTGYNAVRILSDSWTSDEIELCKNADIPLTVYCIDDGETILSLPAYVSCVCSNRLNARKAIYNNAMGIS